VLLCDACVGVPVLQDAAYIRQQRHASQRLPDVRVQYPGVHNTHSGVQVGVLGCNWFGAKHWWYSAAVGAALCGVCCSYVCGRQWQNESLYVLLLYATMTAIRDLPAEFEGPGLELVV
jgi:hypothetical protein